MPPGRPSILTPASFRPVAEVAKARGIAALVYSPPGTGKTTLAASVANHTSVERAILVEFDPNGIESIRNWSNVDVFPDPENRDKFQVSDVAALRRYLAKDEGKTHQAVIIDTITAMQRKAIKEVHKDMSKPVPLPLYGAINNKIVELIDGLRDLTLDIGIHLIVTAHEKEDRNEDTGVVTVRPAMTPGLSDQIFGMMDIVGRIRTGRKGHVVEFEPKPNVYGKFRQTPIGEQVPGTLTLPHNEIMSENYGFSKILTLLGR